MNFRPKNLRNRVLRDMVDLKPQKRNWSFLVLVPGISLLSACNTELLDNPYGRRCFERNILNGQRLLQENRPQKAAGEFKDAQKYASGKEQISSCKTLLMKAKLKSGASAESGRLAAALLKSCRPEETLKRAELAFYAGKSKEKLGQISQAEQLYRESIKTLQEYKPKEDPRVKLLLTDSVEALSDLLSSTGRAEEAANLQESHIGNEEWKNEKQGIDKLSKALAKAHQTTKVEDRIKILNEIIYDPDCRIHTQDFKNAVFILAEDYLKIGESKKAEQTFNELIKVVKSDPFGFTADVIRYQYYFTHICLQENDLRLCLLIGEQALQNQGAAKSHQIAQVHFDRARAYEKLNESENAKQELQTALRFARKSSKERLLREIESYAKKQLEQKPHK